MTARRIIAAMMFLGLTCAATGALAKSVLQAVEETNACGMFLKAVRAGGMVDMLSGEGPFTIFAPTDDAFSSLPHGTYADLLDHKDKLIAFVENHVLAGVVLSRDVARRRREAVTIRGTALTVDGTRGFMVDDAKVTKADIIADNGVVHVINGVLMPE